MADVLTLFYSWPALLVVVAATGTTSLVTTTLEVMGLVSTKPAERPVWVSRLLYPLLPIVLGGLVAAIVPLRPDFLVEHVTAHVASPWGAVLSYAAWGATCGQFSAYLYDRLQDTLRAREG